MNADYQNHEKQYFEFKNFENGLKFFFYIFKQVVFEGSLFSLRHLKDEVPHVTQGQECGIRFQDGSVRFNERDEILCFEMTKEPRFTDWSPGF